MVITTYVVTTAPLYPSGSELEDEWDIYSAAVNDANRKAVESSNNTTFYVHEKVTRPVYSAQRNVTLNTKVIDEGDSDKG